MEKWTFSLSVLKVFSGTGKCNSLEVAYKVKNPIPSSFNLVKAIFRETKKFM